MTSTIPFRKFVLLTSFAGLTGLGVGCIVTTEVDSDECGDPGTHSDLVGNECVCDAGYEWCNDDPDDFGCCRIDDDAHCPDPNSFIDEGLCFCDVGYAWCNPDNPDDLTCCASDDTGAGGTGGGGKDTDTGGTGGTSECPEMTFPDPSSCTEDGLVFCTNTEEAGPACSQYFECEGGEWVERPEVPDQWCQSEQSDFAYGCVDTDERVEFVCGVGPGTPCDDTQPSTCMGTDGISWCLYGKLTEGSCEFICQEVGDSDGIQYDTGFCEEGVDGQAECLCCDFDEPGCEAGGETGTGTTTDGGTGTGTATTTG